MCAFGYFKRIYIWKQTGTTQRTHCFVSVLRKELNETHVILWCCSCRAACKEAAGGDRRADMLESLDFISILLADNKIDCSEGGELTTEMKPGALQRESGAACIDTANKSFRCTPRKTQKVNRYMQMIAWLYFKASFNLFPAKFSLSEVLLSFSKGKTGLVYFSHKP